MIKKLLVCDWCKDVRALDPNADDTGFVLVYRAPIRKNELSPQCTSAFERKSPDLCAKCFDAFLELAAHRTIE